jgi:hypothetical protein
MNAPLIKVLKSHATLATLEARAGSSVKARATLARARLIADRALGAMGAGEATAEAVADFLMTAELAVVEAAS